MTWKTACCDSYQEVTGLPVCICKSRGEDVDLLLLLPHWEHAKQLERFFRFCRMDFALQRRDAAHPLVLMLEPGLFLGVAQLDADTFAIVGPAGPIRPEREQLYRSFLHFMAEDALLPYCDLLLRVPPCTLRKFNNAFSLFLTLCGCPIDPANILLTNNTAQDAPQAAVDGELYLRRESFTYHSSLAYEQALCSAIEEGAPEQLKKSFSAPMQGSEGTMSANPLTQQKYTFIAFVTEVTRAGIRGGLPQETAFSLSDVYCQQMDRMFDANQISSLSYRMALDFCEQVRRYRAGSSYSRPVQLCRDYISEHLHEPISLTELSAKCGLCTRSLSLRFRSETGVPLPDYIHAQRIREAKYLLQQTAYPLSAIASTLQYSSQSYFTQVFKKSCGMTPQKYRDSVIR